MSFFFCFICLIIEVSLPSCYHFTRHSDFLNAVRVGSWTFETLVHILLTFPQESLILAPCR
jgi:hypothetical protein